MNQSSKKCFSVFCQCPFEDAEAVWIMPYVAKRPLRPPMILPEFGLAMKILEL